MWKPVNGPASLQLRHVLDYLLGAESAAVVWQELMDGSGRSQLLGSLPRDRYHRGPVPPLTVTRGVVRALSNPDPTCGSGSSAPDAIRALRQAQAEACGVVPAHVSALARSRLAWQLWEGVDEEWWSALLGWLGRNPGIEPALVNRVLEYCCARHFGAPEAELPADLEFRLPGRTARALLAAEDEWRRTVGALGSAGPLDYPLEGFDLGVWEAPRGGMDGTCYRIVPIRTRAELVREGWLLSHCVARYDSRVRSGVSVICSLRTYRGDIETPRVTLEVQAHTRLLLELSGYRNRRPSAGEWEIIRQWASAERIRLR